MIGILLIQYSGSCYQKALSTQVGRAGRLHAFLYSCWLSVMTFIG